MNGATRNSEAVAKQVERLVTAIEAVRLVLAGIEYPSVGFPGQSLEVVEGVARHFGVGLHRASYDAVTDIVSARIDPAGCYVGVSALVPRAAQPDALTGAQS